MITTDTTNELGTPVAKGLAHGNATSGNEFENIRRTRMATANINTHAFELGDFGKLCKTIPMAAKKNIALVAHDYKKDELLEWAKFNRKLLAAHSLYSTGTTGSILTSQLGLDVTNLQSGPLGGDQQIGSRISEGKIDFLIFFWDPLEAQPHDPDVKALLRIAVVWNVPMACNRASADFVISSALMSRTYDRLVPDYDEYRAQPVPDLSRTNELSVSVAKQYKAESKLQ
jgi:methylglyoxal synthase